MNGFGHAVCAAPSSAHSKVAPASSSEKVQVGVVSLVGPDGPLAIVVSGSVVSTRIVRVVAALWLPAASVVRAV